MIYANETRARQVAAELNARPGHAKAYAVRKADGWTVIACYIPVKVGMFGVLEVSHNGCTHPIAGYGDCRSVVGLVNGLCSRHQEAKNV